MPGTGAFASSLACFLALRWRRRSLRAALSSTSGAPSPGAASGSAPSAAAHGASRRLLFLRFCRPDPVVVSSGHAGIPGSPSGVPLRSSPAGGTSNSSAAGSLARWATEASDTSCTSGASWAGPRSSCRRRRFFRSPCCSAPASSGRRLRLTLFSTLPSTSRVRTWGWAFAVAHGADSTGGSSPSLTVPAAFTRRSSSRIGDGADGRTSRAGDGETNWGSGGKWASWSTRGLSSTACLDFRADRTTSFLEDSTPFCGWPDPSRRLRRSRLPLRWRGDLPSRSRWRRGSGAIRRCCCWLADRDRSSRGRGDLTRGRKSAFRATPFGE